MAKSEGGIVETVKTVVYALLIAGAFRTLFFQPFWIPSESMKDTLLVGDFVFVNKMAYGYSKYSLPFSVPLIPGRIFARTPERGDVVVFKAPPVNDNDYIKRVIGLPGDRIQMIANKLYINDKPVQDVLVTRREIEDIFGPRMVSEVRETLPEGKSFMTQDFGPGNDLDDTPVYEVPVGHYFMMGDNRDNSIDSRVEQSSGVGMVPAENLVGKANTVLSPGPTMPPSPS